MYGVVEGKDGTLYEIRGEAEMPLAHTGFLHTVALTLISPLHVDAGRKVLAYPTEGFLSHFRRVSPSELESRIRKDLKEWQEAQKPKQAEAVVPPKDGEIAGIRKNDPDRYPPKVDVGNRHG